ncbi:MAG: FadR/GntR family transcriptional regulator [Rubricoccaceae bacterium]|nr:FadR/GntR family transcriptional regulator [Rubricoccaceae bacterium]
MPSGPAAPLLRRNLPDDLARRIASLIEAEGYAPGDRLPSIANLAGRFGVGAPTLREALKKLETLGTVVVRHGSGVYVGARPNRMIIPNGALTGRPSKKTLLDLLEARLPVELTTVRLAAAHATPEDVASMAGLLAHAEAHLDDDDVLNTTNMAFHRAIAEASGNGVLHQLLDVLTSLFQGEQRAIMDIYGSRRRDHTEHVEILDALRARDADLAVARMRAHLEGVRAVLLQWDGDAEPDSD